MGTWLPSPPSPLPTSSPWTGLPFRRRRNSYLTVQKGPGRDGDLGFLGQTPHMAR